MRRLAPFIMTCALLITLAPTVSSAADSETATIVGAWKVVEMQARGRAVSEVSWQGMRYEFTKDKLKLWAGRTTPAGLAGKPPLECPYSVENESNPKQFDFTMIAGDSRRDVEAIYRIVDEKLYLCLGKNGRPRSIETQDTKNFCYVLERMPAPDEK